MPEALHLQPCPFHLIPVLLLGHVQFSLALDAHAKLLAALPERLVEGCHLVFGIECLLAQGDGFLLHFNLLLPVVALAVLPFLLFVEGGAEQFGIGQYQDGVARLKHGSLFGHNAFYKSAFQRIDLHGLDGLHDSLYIDKLPEGRVCHIGHATGFAVEPKPARAQ